MYDHYIGIDPGTSGGIAVISAGILTTYPMPATERDVWDVFIQFIGTNTVAVIEKVTGYVGDGGNPGSRMFTFGASYGGLRMALIAACIPFEEITATTWQADLKVPPREKGTMQSVVLTKGKRVGQTARKEVGGESKSNFKNRLKTMAKELFPDQSITLETADAVLIAEYCRRKLRANHPNAQAERSRQANVD